MPSAKKQRERNQKDIIQPYRYTKRGQLEENPDFTKVYGAKAKQAFDKTLRDGAKVEEYKAQKPSDIPI